MWNEKIYDLKEALKTYLICTIFVIVSIALFVILKIFISSTRVYIHSESRKLFKINGITGLLGFMYSIFKDGDDRILVNVTNFEKDKESIDDIELSVFINNYTEFKIASENDRLLYGAK